MQTTTRIITLLAEAISLLGEPDGLKVCRDTNHVSTPHIHIPTATKNGEVLGVYFDPDLPRA